MSREETIKQMLLEGSTLQQVGDFLGLSRERVRQIRKRLFPELTRKNSGATVRVLERSLNRKLQIQERFNRDTYSRLTDLQKAYSLAFTRKKQNVKIANKWEFSITMSDLSWPTHCPILGIELDWFNDVRKENSPSFDRLDPSKGYVAGNVAIISWRANRIKNDGTAEEHEKIANFMRKV